VCVCVCVCVCYKTRNIFHLVSRTLGETVECAITAHNAVKKMSQEWKVEDELLKEMGEALRVAMGTVRVASLPVDAVECAAKAVCALPGIDCVCAKAAAVLASVVPDGARQLVHYVTAEALQLPPLVERIFAIPQRETARAMGDAVGLVVATLVSGAIHGVRAARKASTTALTPVPPGQHTVHVTSGTSEGVATYVVSDPLGTKVAPIYLAEIKAWPNHAASLDARPKYGARTQTSGVFVQSLRHLKEVARSNGCVELHLSLDPANPRFFRDVAAPPRLRGRTPRDHQHHPIVLGAHISHSGYTARRTLCGLGRVRSHRRRRSSIALHPVAASDPGCDFCFARLPAGPLFSARPRQGECRASHVSSGRLDVFGFGGGVGARVGRDLALSALVGGFAVSTRNRVFAVLGGGGGGGQNHVDSDVAVRNTDRRPPLGEQRAGKQSRRHAELSGRLPVSRVVRSVSGRSSPERRRERRRGVSVCGRGAERQTARRTRRALKRGRVRQRTLDGAHSYFRVQRVARAVVTASATTGSRVHARRSNVRPADAGFPGADDCRR